ncbi:5-formyltetrahydrofolate cyclo-ligase [Saccharopolyspora antimicrobica]|uniref:5-formyltetrahydrofolate cyclo-ligase n=1 Tax=Saccharopolyspora antimicrobica TaxID=455193 RepID=A0A1I5EWI3_9PSEU|nr:5-formyltetrahydrofolate cyclo-ligase [Saccharopolyspora antimicrobica]RKT83575.1 5-formyltetrahydrofolate cyclo-ligase [Saccharopolyspora antimicrobica]SFO15854.1 5-formyltetrahydrofolate cyclo-ligase [Saccharopolyspora antimicrobica]
MSSLDESTTTKAEWRSTLLEQRRDVVRTTRSDEAAALQEAVLAWLAEHPVRTVAAYVPVGDEPGSPELLEALRAAGLRVLLPVVVNRRSPLEWADYTGPDSLREATFGLLEPAGQRLGAAAIGEAGALFVPALAVDRRGVRLGRGAGHYDRSLPMAAPGAPLIGVVRDEEFVAELPGEPHDVRMTSVLTPRRGVVSLPV